MKLNKTHTPFSKIVEHIRLVSPELCATVNYNIVSSTNSSLYIEFDYGVCLHVGLDIMGCDQIFDDDGNMYNISSVLTKLTISQNNLINYDIQKYAGVIKKINILNADIVSFIAKQSDLKLFYSFIKSKEDLEKEKIAEDHGSYRQKVLQFCEPLTKKMRVGNKKSIDYTDYFPVDEVMFSLKNKSYSLSKMNNSFVLERTK